MTQEISRRDFLQTATQLAVALPEVVRKSNGASPAPRENVAVSLSPPLRVAERVSAAGPPAPAARPFDLHRVRLLPGMPLASLELNRTYMLGLSPDRLLHTFRINAGIPSAAEPLGGWEAPANELRGHFTGHYLSACALMAAHTGDEAVKARGTLLVRELAKCQAALGGTYLSAFPEEFFDRLKARQRVWAPFYTYHKIMAGLLDTATLSHDAQALAMAKSMADWVKRYADPIPDELWQRMLTTEYGGMNDTLRALTQASGDASYAALATRFDHEAFFAPLAIARDELKGVHGNTNIPKVLGAARHYDMTGDERARSIADFFWEEVTGRRAYATGGTTNGESWQGDAGQLSHALGSHTQESCVTYNMLKLTRAKFSWSPEARYADYYERAFYNGILGTQHPADGEKVYYTPLADGYWKLFGTPDHGFWCCHGSGVENFSKLGDSIYVHDDEGLFVNLFVPSEVNWPEKGIRVRQETAFPEGETVNLTVHATQPTKMAIRVRIPYWATTGGRATLNCRALDAFAGPGSYLVVRRTWTTGDSLRLTLPMTLHSQPMPDDRTLQAIMYGPLVLVARLGTTGITDTNRRAVPTPPREVPVYVNPAPPRAPAITAPSNDPASWLTPVAGKPLEFRTIGQPADLTFVPLYSVFDERYAAYVRVTLA